MTDLTHEEAIVEIAAIMDRVSASERNLVEELYDDLYGKGSFEKLSERPQVMHRVVWSAARGGNHFETRRSCS